LTVEVALIILAAAFLAALTETSCTTSALRGSHS